MKAIFMYDYGKENMKRIEELGYKIDIHNENSFDENDIDYDAKVLCCYDPFARIDVDRFTDLRLIQLSSVGFDFIPKEKIENNNIILSHNKGGYSIPMGEWIVFNLLQLAKHNRLFIDRQKEKKWKMDLKITELFGKTVVFAGTGTIASEGAKRLQGFGMKVIGMNTSGTETEYFDEVFKTEDAKEIFSIADYVVNVLPLTKATEHFMDEEKFSFIKKGAGFINVSRGPVVDEKALIKALEDKHISSAALDVFEKEPLSADNPLWDMENVYITPHNSWISELRDQRRFELIYENLKRLSKDEELLNVVNIRRGY